MRFLAHIAASLVLVAGLAGGVNAGTQSAILRMEVPSATTISIDPSDPPTAGSCMSGEPGITAFGPVLPGTETVTSDDCTVVFGSSNDTSMLRLFQLDQGGTAMTGPNVGIPDLTYGVGDTLVADPGVHWTRTDIDGHSNATRSMVVLADGKTVVAGTTTGADSDLLIARYNADGSPDNTFGSGDGQTPDPSVNWTRTDMTGDDDTGSAVIELASGKFVVAGRSDRTSYDVVIARYNADGTPDLSFGTRDVTTLQPTVNWSRTDLTGTDDHVASVLEMPDGKLVVVGDSQTPTFRAILLRYNEDGTRDLSFGTGDTTVADPTVNWTRIGFAAGTTNIHAATRTADGGLVVSGAANSDFVVGKFNSDGTRDLTFGTGAGALPNGTINYSYSDFTFQSDIAFSITELTDGKLLAVGESRNGDRELALARYNANGTRDLTFGTRDTAVLNPSVHWTRTDVSGGDDRAVDVAVDADGNIIITGWSINGDYEWILARYTSDGIPDMDFGTGDTSVTSQVVNWTRTDFDGGNDQGGAVSPLPDGGILVGGVSVRVTADVALARYTGEGVLDFGGDWAAQDSGFGVCLHSLTNAVPTWTEAGAGNCVTTANANWQAVPATPGGGAKIAESTVPGTTDAAANFRYGFKAASDQMPGTYTAPLVFEVVAPNA